MTEWNCRIILPPYINIVIQRLSKNVYISWFHLPWSAQGQLDSWKAWVTFYEFLRVMSGAENSHRIWEPERMDAEISQMEISERLSDLTIVLQLVISSRTCVLTSSFVFYPLHCTDSYRSIFKNSVHDSDQLFQFLWIGHRAWIETKIVCGISKCVQQDFIESLLSTKYCFKCFGWTNK